MRPGRVDPLTTGCVIVWKGGETGEGGCPWRAAWGVAEAQRGSRAGYAQVNSPPNMVWPVLVAHFFAAVLNV
jgi:hypothetical protein